MYHAPQIQQPGLDDTQHIADKLHLGIPRDDLPEYHDILCDVINSYSVLEKYIEPTIPVKYPRTPGYRPDPEENKYNAWYYRSEIKGAPAGPLEGKTIVIKDSIPVAGVPMMHGSRLIEGYVPDYDPTIVTRILDAGGVIVGKSVCEDLCISGNSFRSHPAPVLNPYDTTRSSGGSSSGNAVLLQQGEVDMAVGADQGGSIRMPSSWTGTVGLMPTYGLVPYTGLGSLSPAVDYCGPMARTVKDCSLLLQVLAGDDGGLDMRQRNTPAPDQIPRYSELLSSDLSGMRIGLVREGFDLSDDDVCEVVRSAAMRLKEKGAAVESISIPIHLDGMKIWMPTSMQGSYYAMVMGQGYCVGPPSFYPTSAIDSYFAAFKARTRDTPEAVKVVQLAGQYIADNYGLRIYAKSQNLIRLLRQKYDEALKNYDVLVMPTMTTTAPKLPLTDSTVKERYRETTRMVINTSPFNGTGHPSLSINAGFSCGLPVGMMITGRHDDDQTVLNVAYA